jgi:hypothetical protein
MSVFTELCDAIDKFLCGSHRILNDAVTGAIDRKLPVMVEKLQPKCGATCRRCAQWLN